MNATSWDFSNLRGEKAVRVRQGNKMALKSVARCAELDDAGKLFSLEHPWRSFLWYMRQTVELASRPGVVMAVYSSCCFGRIKTEVDSGPHQQPRDL